MQGKNETCRSKLITKFKVPKLFLEVESMAFPWFIKVRWLFGATSGGACRWRNCGCVIIYQLNCTFVYFSLGFQLRCMLYIYSWISRVWQLRHISSSIKVWSETCIQQFQSSRWRHFPDIHINIQHRELKRERKPIYIQFVMPGQSRESS